MSQAIQKLSETLQKAEDVLKGLAEPDNSKQDDLDEELVKKYRTRKFNAELLSPSHDNETKLDQVNKQLNDISLRSKEKEESYLQNIHVSL